MDTAAWVWAAASIETSQIPMMHNQEKGSIALACALHSAGRSTQCCYPERATQI